MQSKHPISLVLTIHWHNFHSKVLHLRIECETPVLNQCIPNTYITAVSQFGKIIHSQVEKAKQTLLAVQRIDNICDFLIIINNRYEIDYLYNK